MKHTLFFCLFLLLAVFTSCDNNEEDPCDDCPQWATCVDGVCVWPPNTFYIGGSYHTGYNAYVGILQTDFCPQIDSIFFDVQPNDQFEMFVAWDTPGLNQAYQPGAGTIQKLSDSTYILFTIYPICYYAYMHATIHTDSVNLDFKFWELSNPEVILDSAKVTLYKQWQ